MTMRVSVENLGFTYSRHLADAIFRDVSFSVEAGEIFCLLGPNGTGKSTLLKCLANILQPKEGKIYLDEKELLRLRTSDAAKRVGYVPQNQASAFPFLVRDIVLMGRAPHIGLFASPSRADMEIAYQAMRTAGVQDIAERPCTALSGGEWQLTLIARALAQGPQVLVLDEPTSHLDMGNQMKILRVVKGLAQSGLAVIMASHFPDHAFLLSSEVAILNRGCLAHRGAPERVITEENMRNIYGVKVKVINLSNGLDRKVCVPLLEENSQ